MGRYLPDSARHDLARADDGAVEDERAAAQVSCGALIAGDGARNDRIRCRRRLRTAQAYHRQCYLRIRAANVSGIEQWQLARDMQPGDAAFELGDQGEPERLDAGFAAPDDE